MLLSVASMAFAGSAFADSDRDTTRLPLAPNGIGLRLQLGRGTYLGAASLPVGHEGRPEMAPASPSSSDRRIPVVSAQLTYAQESGSEQRDADLAVALMRAVSRRWWLGAAGHANLDLDEGRDDGGERRWETSGGVAASLRLGNVALWLHAGVTAVAAPDSVRSGPFTLASFAGSLLICNLEISGIAPAAEALRPAVGGHAKAAEIAWHVRCEGRLRPQDLMVHLEGRTMKPGLSTTVWLLGGTVVLAGLVFLVLRNPQSPSEQLVSRARRAGLVTRMRADLAAESEAEKSAVLAATDRDSQVYAARSPTAVEGGGRGAGRAGTTSADGRQPIGAGGARRALQESF